MVEDRGDQTPDEGSEDEEEFEEGPTPSEAAMTVLTHKQFLATAKGISDSWLGLASTNHGSRKHVNLTRSICGSVVLLTVTGGILYLASQGKVSAGEAVSVLALVVSGGVSLLRS